MNGTRVFDTAMGVLVAWYALQSRKPKWLREAMLVGGLGYIAYRAREHLKNRELVTR